jgi:hypothetical protein
MRNRFNPGDFATAARIDRLVTEAFTGHDQERTSR